jgi:hypothetical protein
VIELARRLRTVFEPYHSMVYFAPEIYSQEPAPPAMAQATAE